MANLMKHYYKYLEEYINLTHNVYAMSSPAVFTTYYTLSDPDSVYDKNYMNSYEDVGPRSGLMWNKISLFPVFYGEASSPSLNANEIGVTRQDSVRPYVVVPNRPDFTPKIGDFILFSNLGGESLVYEVINIDYTMPNNRTHFKLALMPSHHKISEIEQQVANRYVYNDLLDIILPEDLGLYMINIVDLILEVDDLLYRQYYTNRLDAFWFNKKLLVDLCYYINLISDNFVSKKIKLQNLYYTDDFKKTEDNSVLALLFEDSFAFSTYNVLITKLDRSTLTSGFQRRVNGINQVELFRFANSNDLTYESILTNYLEYEQTQADEVTEAFNQLFVFKTNGMPIINQATVVFAKRIYEYIQFLQDNTNLPQQLDSSHDNILDLLFVFFFTDKIGKYALSQAISGL